MSSLFTLKFKRTNEICFVANIVYICAYTIEPVTKGGDVATCFFIIKIKIYCQLCSICILFIAFRIQ